VRVTGPSNGRPFSTAISKIARACACDRAGMGVSDPNPRASTSSTNVEDLRLLLRAARISPLYILGARVWLGLNTPLYAERFRKMSPTWWKSIPLPQISFRGDAATSGAFSQSWNEVVKQYRRCAKNVGAGYDIRSKASASPLRPSARSYALGRSSAPQRSHRAPVSSRRRAARRGRGTRAAAALTAAECLRRVKAEIDVPRTYGPLAPFWL
jgi:hypothetical protein